MTSREAPPRRARVLLTNDDGVHAPGLLALAERLGELADVAIIAPDHNWSAAGHGKTMHKPLRVWPAELANGFSALMTNGSPTDCVALGLLGLLEDRPDLVVSGINLGANVGHDLTYSGTVAAAMEGFIGGVTAIAASLDTYEVEDFCTAAHFVAGLTRYILDARLNEPLLLNVNVPALPEKDIQGVRVTRLGRRVYRDALVRRVDPRGRSYYWIGGEPPVGIPEKGTDIGALAEGYVSITPLSLDLTDHSKASLLRTWELTFAMS